MVRITIELNGEDVEVFEGDFLIFGLGTMEKNDSLSLKSGLIGKTTPNACREAVKIVTSNIEQTLNEKVSENKEEK